MSRGCCSLNQLMSPLNVLASSIVSSHLLLLHLSKTLATWVDLVPALLEGSKLHVWCVVIVLSYLELPPTLNSPTLARWGSNHQTHVASVMVLLMQHTRFTMHIHLVENWRCCFQEKGLLMIPVTSVTMWQNHQALVQVCKVCTKDLVLLY